MYIHVNAVGNADGNGNEYALDNGMRRKKILQFDNIVFLLGRGR